MSEDNKAPERAPESKLEISASHKGGSRRALPWATTRRPWFFARPAERQISKSSMLMPAADWIDIFIAQAARNIMF